MSNHCRVSTVVVQRFCKPKVGGSNPSPGTISPESRQEKCPCFWHSAVGWQFPDYWQAPTAPPTHDYVHWRPASEKQKPVPFRDTHSAVSGYTNGPASQAASNTVAPNGTIGPRSGVP